MPEEIEECILKNNKTERFEGKLKILPEDSYFHPGDFESSL